MCFVCSLAKEIVCISAATFGAGDRWFLGGTTWRSCLETRRQKISFTGNMRRYSNFEQTVRMLEKTGGLIFNIEGRTIYITEK